LHAQPGPSNNLGTAFDLQAVSIAFFLGREYAAEMILRHTTVERILTVIEPDVFS
jgi:hypothetical protein